MRRLTLFLLPAAALLLMTATESDARSRCRTVRCRPAKCIQTAQVKQCTITTAAATCCKPKTRCCRAKITRCSHQKRCATASNCSIPGAKKNAYEEAPAPPKETAPAPKKNASPPAPKKEA